ncbi:MAG: hypothetical protein IPP13_18140 [Kouleothrix sp.]|jgi:hypothetical protein|nr:hypothetical protein [Kouleothrix sp.]
MSTDDFRSDTRALLQQLLAEAQSSTNNDVMLEVYVDEFTRLHSDYAHKLLNDVFNDARTRIDARLSPDPIRQTIATVQTTVQDIWKSLTETIGGGPPQLK